MVCDCGSDPQLAETIAVMLQEHVRAKQLLRDAGIGWSGLGLVQTVELALSEHLSVDTA
jgi:hypothetical protein